MSQETDNRVEQLQVMLADRDQLKRELSDKQESLNREVYQLETTEIRLRIAEEEIQALESLTLASIFSSIAGTKISKLDSLREQIQNLEQEHQAHSRNLETIQQQIDAITAQIEATASAEEELHALCPDSATTPQSGGAAQTRRDSHPAPPDRACQLEWVIEAGESLLTHLNGMYTLCNNIRRKKGIGGRGGALLEGALHACRSRSASAVTAQLTESVGHFCSQVAALQLDPGIPAEAEILGTLSQVQRFADPSSGALGTQSDAWVDLEVLVRSLVSDLRELRT